MIKKRFWNILLFCQILIWFIALFSVVFGAEELERNDNQFMELKATSIEETSDGSKQITLEWWSYNLSFKGLDLRFSYDQDKVVPSSIQDNSTVTVLNGEDSFEFLGDFASYMDYFTFSVENGEYRCVMSLENYDDSGTYIENDPNLGYIVNSNVEGGVLIGKMSFKLLEGKQLDSTTFALKPGNTSPQTGIKIDQTALTCYSVPEVFRFTLLSSDASLKQIDYDFFNYEDNNSIPTLEYTTLDLTKPDTDSTDEISKYTINLLEYVDNISFKLQKSDENSIIKMNGNEIDVQNSQELVLNKIGNEDTQIDIEVTAQNGTATHTYRLIIHRPFGTIKGKIITKPTETTTGLYKSNINIYNSEDVSEIIDYSSITPGNLDDIHDKLLTLTSQNYISNDDGTYEIYVIPGKYDILLDKEGYLDHIYVSKSIQEGDLIDLGTKELIAGDINKDSSVQLLDLTSLISAYGIDNTDPSYELKYDFNNDDEVQLLDLTVLLSNYSESRNIE